MPSLPTVASTGSVTPGIVTFTVAPFTPVPVIVLASGLTGSMFGLSETSLAATVSAGSSLPIGLPSLSLTITLPSSLTVTVAS